MGRRIPIIDTIKLNATSLLNLSADNLTLNYTTSDVDGDNVNVSVLWIRDNRSWPAVPITVD